MQASFTIEGRMPGLNEYTKANRNRKWPEGSQMKGTETERAAWAAKAAHVPRFTHPVWVTFHWFEPKTNNKRQRRDIDNVAFAKKFILDGLKMAGVIVDDSPEYVIGFKDVFSYSNDPHIVVTLSEMSP